MSTAYQEFLEAKAQVATTYIAQYAGRDDAYAAWGGEHWITACAPGCARCSWMGSHRGDEVPDEVPGHDRARLTPGVILTAFQTRSPISGYVLGVDSTTHLACLDVDTDDGLMIADRVARTMKRTGLPAYIEPSRRGAHLWCVLDAVLPGIVIRRALRGLLQAADVEPDPKIELRPGQDDLSGERGLGYALRMPLMPHQKTGVGGELLEPGGRIVASKIAEAVTNVQWASAPILAEWAEKWVDPTPLPPLREPGERPRSIERFNDQVGVVEVLMRDWGVTRARPGQAIRCPAHDDRNPSLSILRDDRRVVCHSPSCDFNNGGRGRDAWDLAQMAPGARSGAA